MNYIKPFSQITLADLPQVGGKNANLGQMMQGLASSGIVIPDGFAITADAYWHVLDVNQIRKPIGDLMKHLGDGTDSKLLATCARQARCLIDKAQLPTDLAHAIVEAYKKLSDGERSILVAVRSSATAEDLPTASFAGQQETYLDIKGESKLLEAVKKCMASLFTDRAILYRIEHSIDHMRVALSVGIQKMVEAKAAGVAFSLETETGFKDVVVINAGRGLGEAVVQGAITPDEYVVHKPTLASGDASIIKKKLGAQSDQFVLTNDEILNLARQVATIERYYSELKKAWSPMDVEWAKDGKTGKILIVQARPETVHAHESGYSYSYYSLKSGQEKKVLTTGQSIGQKIVRGKVRVIAHIKESDQLKAGEILVTTMTDPDWVVVMRRAAGIITARGGRTCHAAIVSRELGIPAIVGAQDALQLLKNGMEVTIDCSAGETGFVYAGGLSYEQKTIDLKTVPELPTQIMINIADPNSVFALARLPVAGVGLARIEFIIANTIGIHPMALIHPEKVADRAIGKEIAHRARAYPNEIDFFVQTLAQGIGMIAAAFYPKPVIVRFSDFKSNEYRQLLAGSYFEQEEENPMLGFRGASRYTHPHYAQAFALECAAMNTAITTMGFTNIKPMIPFVRTVEEGNKVLELMAAQGLRSPAFMMCELPANVVLIKDFSALFEGFSIGSNDLTQLTLGVDRDSALVAPLFDERNPAVIGLMEMAINGAHAANRHIGICGQGPSDYPELARKLIAMGIDSISLNPDAVMPFYFTLAK